MMITAHSGCNGTRMNTMEYLEFASSLPIDALEIDIRRSKDGRLLLTHDQIREQPRLTLDEAFAFLLEKSLVINCDLKEYGLEEAVLECADKYGIRNRIIFTGSITDCMNFMKDHSCINVFINAEELLSGIYEKSDISAADWNELIFKCHAAGYHVINIDYRVCDETLINKCKTTEIGLSVWTVDNIELIEDWELQGAVSVTTNLAKESCSRLKRTMKKG